MLHIILLLFTFTHVFCTTPSHEDILFSQDNTTWYLSNTPPANQMTHTPGLHIYLQRPEYAFQTQNCRTCDASQTPEPIVSAYHVFESKEMTQIHVFAELLPCDSQYVLHVSTAQLPNPKALIFSKTIHKDTLKINTEPLQLSVSEGTQSVQYVLPCAIIPQSYIQLSSSPEKPFAVSVYNNERTLTEQCWIYNRTVTPMTDAPDDHYSWAKGIYPFRNLSAHY